MIPIKTFTGESFIRQQGNFVRELRKLLQSPVELVFGQFLRRGTNVSGLFEQTSSIRFELDAMRSRLAGQLRFTSGLTLIIILIVGPSGSCFAFPSISIVISRVWVKGPESLQHLGES
jgi:hypothetical protein